MHFVCLHHCRRFDIIILKGQCEYKTYGMLERAVYIHIDTDHKIDLRNLTVQTNKTDTKCFLHLAITTYLTVDTKYMQFEMRCCVTLASYKYRHRIVHDMETLTVIMTSLWCLVTIENLAQICLKTVRWSEGFHFRCKWVPYWGVTTKKQKQKKNNSPHTCQYDGVVNSVIWPTSRKRLLEKVMQNGGAFSVCILNIGTHSLILIAYAAKQIGLLDFSVVWHASYSV